MIGFAGQPLSASHIADVRTQEYQWINDDGSNMRRHVSECPAGIESAASTPCGARDE